MREKTESDLKRNDDRPAYLIQDREQPSPEAVAKRDMERVYKRYEKQLKDVLANLSLPAA